MTPPTPRIASTTDAVADVIASICAWTSSVALAVWLARFFTSDATTAKPLPASPARAASMVAFNASRLVCAAMLRIRSTTSTVRLATLSSCSISW